VQIWSSGYGFCFLATWRMVQIRSSGYGVCVLSRCCKVASGQVCSWPRLVSAFRCSIFLKCCNYRCSGSGISGWGLHLAKTFPSHSYWASRDWGHWGRLLFLVCLSRSWRHCSYLARETSNCDICRQQFNKQQAIVIYADNSSTSNKQL
jgi:hypothetical protein